MMNDKKVERLILKDDDILVVKVPSSWLIRRDSVRKLYKNIKNKLLPKKNKIMIIPMEMELSIIGKKEVEEYISHIDLWDLWEDEEV